MQNQFQSHWSNCLQSQPMQQSMHFLIFSANYFVIFSINVANFQWLFDIVWMQLLKHISTFHVHIFESMSKSVDFQFHWQLWAYCKLWKHLLLAMLSQNVLWVATKAHACFKHWKFFLTAFKNCKWKFRCKNSAKKRSRKNKEFSCILSIVGRNLFVWFVDLLWIDAIFWVICVVVIQVWKIRMFAKILTTSWNLGKHCKL